MNNAELAARLDRIIDALEGIEAGLAMLCEAKMDEQDRVELAQERTRLIGRALLAGRWPRLAGNVYGAPAGRVSGPSFPIAGGDDNQAKVDVPSGARRA